MVGIVIPPTRAAIKKVNSTPNELWGSEEVTKQYEERAVRNFVLEPKNRCHHLRQKNEQKLCQEHVDASGVRCSRQARPQDQTCKTRWKQTLTWKIAKCSSHHFVMDPEAFSYTAFSQLHVQNRCWCRWCVSLRAKSAQQLTRPGQFDLGMPANLMTVADYAYFRDERFQDRFVRCFDSLRQWRDMSHES